MTLNTLKQWKPYPHYKPSGVDFLGDIPDGWEVKRLKWIVSKIGSGKTPKGGAEIYSDSGIIFLRSQNIHFDGLRLDDVVYINKDIDKAMSSSRVKPLDILLNITGASLGRCMIIPKDFPSSNVNQHVCILRPIVTRINPYFLNRVMSSNAIQNQIFSSEVGVSREGLTFAQAGNLISVFPSLPEQEKIAQFLDEETAKIDKLITHKQRLIELLKEKRTALISHAVTKGLNPDVPMKDSGVEWLGFIPEHWEVKKIKRLSLVKRGASPRPIDDPIYFDDNGEYVWVRISDVTASNKYLLEAEQKLSEIGKRKSVPLQPNELFLSICASVGKPIITKIKCCIHDGFVYFPELKENREYLYYIFLGGELYKGLGKMGTQLNLNTEIIGDVKLPIPPVSEQQKIAEYLDEKTEQIDPIIKKTRESIEYLKEYRTALISAAVTGKIDVRQWGCEEVRE
ncbi:restriction modification system DNA specificity domain protein [Rippkaea orientalis PCC 8801]|uniref:Restriction modification system DNA specificity domain protein n=1 Tax=Rippkaea orientalis (strain PCC 8801 / RF-1) TaxID=41431 RepID=B7K558_RIPO1|nr:restriction endonuclease subunit S [Rippkaea orientalis]ACK67884.1 restriction modification system DNA specificity domain protein [Rippkaea orientalis PCC 8801]